MSKREFTESDRATIRFKLSELFEGLEDMDDSDVCGVLVGMYCYAVSKTGNDLKAAISIVERTWPAVQKLPAAQKPKGN